MSNDSSYKDSQLHLAQGAIFLMQPTPNVTTSNTRVNLWYNIHNKCKDLKFIYY
jgi:hypothetical protein